MDEITSKVQEYYGKILTTTNDLKTSTCCDSDTTPDWLKAPMANIHPEVAGRYYGCGLVAPEKLLGARILDLGSGSGRDCYLLSQLVGESGFVLGVDMTDEQLAVANKHLEFHREKFNYGKSNVEFKKGRIEHLDQLELPDNYFDIIVSNCVINLSADKAAVFKEAYRVLKPGGEMYFADVYANKRMSRELIEDPILYGECLSGALYWNDFFRLARKAGFTDPRLVSSRVLEMHNKEIEAKTQDIEFYSTTYRLFKILELEEQCEDYGQTVRYLGSIKNQPHEFKLDANNIFTTDQMTPVCGNTYRMLAEGRFAADFEFFGDFSAHHGGFNGCGTNQPDDIDKTACC